MQNNSPAQTNGLLILAVFGVHLSLLWLPPINLEWAFFDVIRFFETDDMRYADRYFSVQANPLGLSYASFLLSRLLPGLDVEYAPRVLSALGVLLLGYALVRLGRALQLRRDMTVLLLLVLVNPLVWVYSGRGTADFLPAALALFSVSLLWDKSTGAFGTVTALCALSLAILLKYHAVLLLPMIWIEALSRPHVDYRSQWVRLCVGSALVLAGPCLYIYFVHLYFGFWLVPPKLQAAFEISPSAFLTNLTSYFGYLSLLLLPLNLLSVVGRLSNARSVVRVALVACALFLLGYFVLRPDGEMNFGPFDRFLTEQFANGLICISAGLFILVLLDGYRAQKHHAETLRLMACMAVGIAIFLAALSLTRPAQRYLLFVLPMAYFFLAVHLHKRTAYIVATVLLLVSINALIGISQYATGSAAREVVQKLRAGGLIDDTYPGAILWHAGNAFSISAPAKRHHVVAEGHRPGELFCATSAPVPFIRREFCVIPH